MSPTTVNHNHHSLGSAHERFDGLSRPASGILPRERGLPDVLPNWAIESLDDVKSLCRELRQACQAAVQGRDEVIDLILIALLADGHVLLEDHPGSGKTTLSKALGHCLAGDADSEIAPFRRIQFTPDLLPSDVIGATLFDTDRNDFSFRPGPIFANVVLADEINRTSPKVQAALLEAMGEKQVTVDNTTYPLEDLFFVIATQNPLDLVGTYPLPRAQLDRFLFKIRMTYLSRSHELEVLTQRAQARREPPRVRVSPAAIVAARRVLRAAVSVSPAIREGLVDIAQALRNDRRVSQGISTRSLVLAIPALQARAALMGRDYVSHDDLRLLADPLFSHRLGVQAGVKDPTHVVLECLRPILDQLARRTLR